MKTKKEIIKETADFYSADVSRRSKEEEWGDCCYLGPDNKRCAFSRCCKEDEETVKILKNYEGGNSDTIFSDGKESILKEEYQGHCKEFWRDLQRFHDNDENWDENGLTETGVEKLRVLNEIWKH